MIKKELSITLKALAGAGAFILGNVVAGVCICKKNMKEIAKAENQNNYSYKGIFQKLRLNISANVDNAYIASLSGAALPEIHLVMKCRFSKVNFIRTQGEAVRVTGA